MNNVKDIRMISIRYMSYMRYSDKNIRFKSPQYRHDIVKLIVSVEGNPNVFRVTGHTLNGTFI